MKSVVPLSLTRCEDWFHELAPIFDLKIRHRCRFLLRFIVVSYRLSCAYTVGISSACLLIFCPVSACFLACTAIKKKNYLGDAYEALTYNCLELPQFRPV